MQVDSMPQSSKSPPALRKLLQMSVNAVPWRVRSMIKHVPVVAPLQRWLVHRYLHGKDFLHLVNAGPARGLVYPVHLPDDKGIWTGTYENHFCEAIASAVKAGDVCYDIGGYRGFMSGVMALAGASLVVTFEPLEANCAQLARVAKENPRLPLRLEPVAIGSSDGTISFQIMPEASMGKIDGSPFQPGEKARDTVTVPMRRLDSLVAEGKTPPPHVIKIDVEGAEVYVLEGAREVLKKHRPTLFIEAHSPELAATCDRILRETGYDVTVLETGVAPAARAVPDVCHLVARPSA